MANYWSFNLVTRACHNWAIEELHRNAMSGNRDDLLRFCRTYIHFMASEIGIRGELNMEPDSDYAMSIKTSDGNFTPVIGEVSESRDLNAPATALQRGRDKIYRELSSYVLVFVYDEGGQYLH